MATSINFPDSPNVNDEYVYGDVTYIWDGTRWHAKYQTKALSALTDTVITTGNTSDTEVLTWDESSDKWTPEPLSVGVAELKGELKDSTINTTPSDVIPYGEQVYTTPGSYTFTATTNSVSVVAIGGGGGGHTYSSYSHGGGGGGLGWKNNIPVISGNTYTVEVGARGNNSTSSSTSQTATAGGDSYFISASTVCGFGGGAGFYNSGASQFPAGGLFSGDSGGNGGVGGGNAGTYASGGGGAGGYSGDGGAAGGDTAYVNGEAGSGGGGGGGGNAGSSDGASGGGGTGLYGEGASGVAGVGSSGNATSGGGGGSGGSVGGIWNSTGGGYDSTAIGGFGGQHGGGGGASDSVVTESGDGGDGAIRIIWGSGASFPASGTTSGSTEGVFRDINWNDGIQFEYTMLSATTIGFKNIIVGKTITLVISGNYTLTLPDGVNVADIGNFDGAKTNYIQIYCVDDVTPIFLAGLKNYE